MTSYGTPVRYRSRETVLRDGVTAIAQDDRETTSVRRSAVIEVLCRLPETAYEVLRDRAPVFEWSVAGHWDLGRFLPPFSSTNNSHHSIVQLASSLENEPWSVVVTVVAHELAHIILDHAVTEDQSAREQQEIDTWNAIRDWGFAAEADEAEFWLSHR